MMNQMKLTGLPEIGTCFAQVGSSMAYASFAVDDRDERIRELEIKPGAVVILCGNSHVDHASPQPYDQKEWDKYCPWLSATVSGLTRIVISSPFQQPSDPQQIQSQEAVSGLLEKRNLRGGVLARLPHAQDLSAAVRAKYASRATAVRVLHEVPIMFFNDKTKNPDQNFLSAIEFLELDASIHATPILQMFEGLQKLMDKSNSR